MSRFLLFVAVILFIGAIAPVSAQILEGLAGKCNRCHIQEYLGAEKCLECHEADYTQWTKGPHGPNRANVQCERCHGSGEEHVEDPYDLLKIINLREIPVTAQELEKSYVPPKLQSGFCAKCHMEKYIEIKNTPSIYRAASCPVCHMPHGTDNPAATVRPGDKLCTRCHSLVPGNILSLSAVHNINTTGYQFPEHSTELKCINCHMPTASKATSHRIIFTSTGCINCHPGKDEAWVSSKVTEWKRISEEKVMHEGEPSLIGEIKSTSELRHELYTTWHFREIADLGKSAGLVAILLIFSIPLTLWMRKEGLWR